MLNKMKQFLSALTREAGWVGWTISGASLVLYTAAFPVFYQDYGPGITGFSLVPIAICGGVFGLRGGLLAAFSLMGVNSVWFELLGDSALQMFIKFLPGEFGAVGAGWVVGKLRDTYVTIREQSRILEREHEALEEESEMRRQAQEALRRSHENLENKVQERTAELAEANKQLEAEIQERTVVEEQLRESLEEKEVLLKEVHHRVKNNLQIISSLLYLGSRERESKRFMDIIQESRARIRSMAMVHEKLYQTENLSQISFRDYTEDLVKSLVGSHNDGSSNITVDIRSNGVQLDISTAITCGLILNELISNAVKYAFPDNEDGEIVISIAQDNSGRYEMIVKDNGVGLPDDFSTHASQSLGMKLVDTLTQQIDGDLQIDGTSGTKYRLTFTREER